MMPKTNQAEKIGLAIILAIMMASCQTKEKKVSTKEPTESSEIVKDVEPITNVLCKINGEPWNYTKASGIVVSNPQNGKRILRLTFTKQLDRGKEHLGLEYDEATKELFEASVQIKRQGKEGKRIHAIYQFNDFIAKEHPSSNVSGNVVFGEETVSGSALIQNLPISYEGHLLANPKDKIITITDLAFENIGYSDVKKEMGKLFNNN